MEASRRTVAWLDPAQLGLVRTVVEVSGLELVGAGSAARGQSGAVAAEFGVPAFDDLRAMLAATDCDLVWIASPGRFGSGAGTEDAAAVTAAHSRGVRIATMEPIPAAALDLDAGGWTADSGEGRAIDAVRVCPLFRDSPFFRDAQDSIEAFGSIGTLAIECWGGAGEGSLGSRLYASLELVLALMGEPESIEAAYVSGAAGRAVHALPGESLRELSGDLTATMRFADGRAAGIVASDRAGRWNRTVTLVGPEGRLRIFDDGYEWVAPTGDQREQSRKRRRGQTPKLPLVVAAMSHGLVRVLDGPATTPSPFDHAALLAVAQAALLSCRTGQGESPATIRRMVGVV